MSKEIETGPNIGLDIGVRDGKSGTTISSMAEASLCNFEKRSSNGTYSSAGFNLNTGGRLNSDGVDVKVAGFGFNLGKGGVGFSTPFFSFGKRN